MKEIMTVQEAAEFLSIHPKNLYKLISQRRIPFTRKPGIGYRFIHSQLIKWLKEDLELASEWKNVI